VSEDFDLTEIQGNILRGYRRKQVRHLMLEIRDQASGRAFLGKAAAGGDGDVPAIAREQPWIPRDARPPKADIWFNVGLTYDGLKALGIPAGSLASFPTEFIEGMATRAVKIGDVGDSAPGTWSPPFDRPDRIHLVASIYADSQDPLDRAEGQVKRAFAILDKGRLDGRSLPDDRVFFGYIDNISQPRFDGVVDPEQYGLDEPLDPLGTALLGHPTRVEGLTFRMPSPEKPFGRNGAFNAFRVLAQDCKGFEDYLSEAANWLLRHDRVGDLLTPEAETKIVEAHAEAAKRRAERDAQTRIDPPLDRAGVLREIVAAQMCGRWRLNGAPLAKAPDWPDPSVSLTNFDYDRDFGCPVGAHIRRNNPRGGKIVQRVASRTRRLVRRGMVYGPDFDAARPDRAERGLIGNFIGASLGAQFEAVMYDWMNRGLQHPDITGSNDPLLGANAPETSWFDLRPRRGPPIRLRGFPRFVTTRGGVYTFLPSLPALAYLAALAG
jgi:deferrochelatase/peroxidase EfeB